MRLGKLAIALSLLALLWLSLPISHWPGYPSKSIWETGHWVWAALWIPVAATAIVVVLISIWLKSRNRLAWVLGFLATVALLGGTSLSQLYSPFFIPSALVLLLAAIASGLGRRVAS